jgi:hypothetical protein
MGSMTAGGVSSIALCRDALERAPGFDEGLQKGSLTSLWDGLGWLGHCFSVKGNPIGIPDSLVAIPGGADFGVPL